MVCQKKGHIYKEICEEADKFFIEDNIPNYNGQENNYTG